LSAFRVDALLQNKPTEDGFIQREKSRIEMLLLIGEFAHSNSVAQFGELRARKWFGQYIGE
jgi:hypothetical protein